MTKLSDFIGALEIGDAHQRQDTALEIAAASAAGPGAPTQPRFIVPGGTCIADSTLEAVSGAALNPTQVSCSPITRRPICVQPGDEVIETAALFGPTPTMRRPAGFCISDGVLEEAAFSGPTTTRPRQFGGTCVDDSAFTAAV